MEKNVVVLVRQEGLGSTAAQDRKFALEMFDKFLHTIETQAVKPRAICFYTEGVKLVVEGSPVVPGLKLLEGLGIRLLVCKSCIEYYGLASKVAVGKIGGMNDILKLLLEADSTITV